MGGRRRIFTFWSFFGSALGGAGGVGYDTNLWNRNGTFGAITAHIYGIFVDVIVDAMMQRIFTASK
jgi:hypothetical protein